MKTREAKAITSEALEYLSSEFPKVFEWASEMGDHVFDALRAKQFLSAYCYCIYTSGMNMDIVQKYFPRIKKAFKDFEPSSLERMTSVEPVLRVFNNRRKAECFLRGAHAVIDEGYSTFKVRLHTAFVRGRKKKDFTECLDILQELPGCGPVISKMLAKNIGLIDIAKDDRWLRRAAKLVDATVSEFSSAMSRQFSVPEHLIDVAIFQYGRDFGFGNRDFTRAVR
jgi:3-methyladenine DNA glycosylase Tag